jgi:O-antigen/teichoic acid export membrane protein
MKPLVKNFFSLLIGNVGSRILGFFVTVYLARVLEVSGFGKLQFALAFFSYGLILINPGLLLLGTREVVKDRGKIGEYVPSIMLLRLLLAILSFLLIVSLLFILPKSETTKTLIIFYSLSLFVQAFLLEWVFQGTEEMEYIGLSRIMVFVVYLPLVFLFVKGPEMILRVPLFLLGGNIAASLLLILIFLRRKESIRLHLNSSLLIPLLRRSLPLGLAAVMIQIYLYFDTLLLGLFKGDEVVGLYNAAYKLVFFVLILDRVFIESFFPLISRYYRESLERLQNLLKNYAKLITALVIPIGIGGTLLAVPILDLVFGPQYLRGVIAFQILIWVVSLSSINSVYGYGLIGCDQEKKYTLAISLGTMSNLILNFLLIPPYGLMGAAIATLLSEGIMFTLMVIQFERIVKVEFWKFLLRPVLAALGMGILIHQLMHLHIIILVIIGFFAYVILLFLFKGISIEEITLLKRKT